MRPSRPSLPLLYPRLALLMSVALLAGLAGCGPASDNAPNLGPRANVAGPPLAQKITAPRIDPAAPAASPVPSAADNGNATTSDRGITSGANSISQGERLQSQPADTPNGKSVPLIPDSITRDLDSPDAAVRLQALSHWGSKGTTAPLDPLFEAMDDEDPAVQAKAIEIIERYWAAEQERERS